MPNTKTSKTPKIAWGTKTAKTPKTARTPTITRIAQSSNLKYELCKKIIDFVTKSS